MHNAGPHSNPSASVRKVVLAYSGGLDTSVILAWLRETYGCEIVAFTADIGQGEEVEPARKKAEAMGVREIFIEDLREEFVRDFVFPMLRANAVYEGEYLLGTSIARPLIAKRLAEIARETGADAASHGATGKGNDQVRFELGLAALAPDLRVVAPWREWDLTSREKLLAYAASRDIPVEQKRGTAAPYSMDANLLHISYEGGELEDPAVAPPPGMWRRTVDISDAPDDGEVLEIEFVSGDPVSVNGEQLSPALLLAKLNELGGRNGVGRADLVENRHIGMKSRGCYETPGGTVLLRARRALEALTLDREVMRLRDDLTPRYAALVYNGYWWSPERALLQGLFDESQRPVSGAVSLRLQKGNVSVLSRRSPESLYDSALSTFEDDAGAYDQRDAGGFIRLSALRLRLQSERMRKESERTRKGFEGKSSGRGKITTGGGGGVKSESWIHRARQCRREVGGEFAAEQLPPAGSRLGSRRGAFVVGGRRGVVGLPGGASARVGNGDHLLAESGGGVGGDGGFGRNLVRLVAGENLGGDEHDRRVRSPAPGRVGFGERRVGAGLSGVRRMPPRGDRQHRHLRRMRPGNI